MVSPKSQEISGNTKSGNAMTTISPAPFPETGIREFSTKEILQRVKAIACTLPPDNMPRCSGQVFVGLFFDGTGNNREADYVKPPKPERKHSNIVRLFHAFPHAAKKPGHYPIYVPGVGTPFPEIGDRGTGWSAAAGSASAWKGEDRIIWGLLQLINAPHRFAYGNAPLIRPDDAATIVGNVASSTTPGALRRVILSTWLDKLSTALNGRKPSVEQINLSVFGFSRGAAQARTFVNWLFEVCKKEGGGWTLAGIPFRVQFLGLFDTVASVGAANLLDNGVLAGHQSWADNTQEIHPAVEQCVHYVAGHEVRACFPLDSVRVKSAYPPNAREVMYPGSHSDVGGGYAPGALGVSPAPESMIAILPGAAMYREAKNAGVPLLGWHDLAKQFQDDLTPSPEVVRDFNAYLAAAGVGAGPVEEMCQRHMALYFSHRFKHRAEFEARAPHASATNRDKGHLQHTQQALLERLGSLACRNVTVPNRNPHTGQLEMPLLPPNPMNPRWRWREAALAPDFDPNKAAEAAEKNIRQSKPAPFNSPALADKHAIAVARRIDTKKLTPEIERFFERYLHDSMAGFLGMGMDEYRRNGFGFVKFRTVFRGND